LGRLVLVRRWVRQGKARQDNSRQDKAGRGGSRDCRRRKKVQVHVFQAAGQLLEVRFGLIPLLGRGALAAVSGW
jgi:hypothetical protein